MLVELASENFSSKPLDVPVDKLDRSEAEARLVNPVSVQNETVCDAAGVNVRSSAPFGDVSKDGGDLPIPREGAVIHVVEAEEYVAVLGSSTPVRCDEESEGFTFRESVRHVFLRDSGGVLDTSGLFLCRILFQLIFITFSFSCVDSHIGHYVILF